MIKHLMKIIWYCPNCNRETMNWKQCQICRQDAVRQRFVFIPIHDGEIVEKIVLKKKNKPTKKLEAVK